MNQLIVLPKSINHDDFLHTWTANPEAPAITPGSGAGQSTYASAEVLNMVYTIAGSVAVNVASNLIYDALKRLFGGKEKTGYKVEKTEPSPGTIVWIVQEEALEGEKDE